MNSMRLIDADALEQFFLDESKRLRAMLNSPDCDEETKQYIKSFAPTVEWARKTVHHCSTIDAIPVVHGRWGAIFEKLWNVEFEVVTGFECSNCGHLEGFESNYCPNCGAKMDGEADA